MTKTCSCTETACLDNYLNSIDYANLAERLYHATWGRAGTNGQEVFDVFLEGIRRPVKQVLSDPPSQCLGLDRIYLIDNIRREGWDRLSREFKIVQEKIVASTWKMRASNPLKLESTAFDVVLGINRTHIVSNNASQLLQSMLLDELTERELAALSVYSGIDI